MGVQNPITVEHQTVSQDCGKTRLAQSNNSPFTAIYDKPDDDEKILIWSDLGGLSFNFKPRAWNVKGEFSRILKWFQQVETIIHFENHFKHQNIVILYRFKEGHSCFYLIFKPLWLPQLPKTFSYLQLIKNLVVEGFNWCHLSLVLLPLCCQLGGGAAFEILQIILQAHVE